MAILLNNEEFIKCKRLVFVYLQVCCSQAVLTLHEAGFVTWQCSQELDLMLLKVFSNISDSVVPVHHAVLALGSARFGSAWISPKVFQRHIWADDVWDLRPLCHCPKVAQGFHPLEQGQDKDPYSHPWCPPPLRTSNTFLLPSKDAII